MKTEATEKIKEREDDKPDYQEKIMFLVSTSAQGAILAWCLIVLSLGYINFLIDYLEWIYQINQEWIQLLPQAC